MRKFNVTVNGRAYSVEVEEVGSVNVPSAEKPAAPAAPKAPVAPAPVGGSPVKAPMPGLLLKLVVSSGAKVKKGDKVAILEAMKMENDILASADGTISFVLKSGDSVNTGDIIASIS